MIAVHLPLLSGQGTLPLLRADRVLSPSEGTVLADAPWRVFGVQGFEVQGVVEVRDPRRGDLRRLPPGTPVCLLMYGVGARPRLRRVARRAGIVLERELIAMPSTRHPVVLFDDHPDAVHTFWRSVLAPPPGLARGWLPVTLLIMAGRRLPWTWTGAAAPGRVVLGRKS